MKITVQLCHFATLALLVATQLSGAAVSRVIYATNINAPAAGIASGIDGTPGNVYVATDQSGNSVIATTSARRNYLQHGESDPAFFVDGFLTKISADGKNTIFTTSMKNALVTAVTVDSAGAIYLAGSVYSDGPFDTTAGALQKDAPGGFFTKLSPQGTVVYSSRIPAQPRAIAVDATGAIYLTGIAKSDFRTTPGAYKPDIGEARCSNKVGIAYPCTDAFVAKISPDGATLLYGTFLGGTLDDSASAIAIDSTGSAYIVGETISSDFKTTAGAFQPGFSGTVTLGPFTWGDGFAARLDPTGHTLVYATYLGGSGVDFSTGVAVDAKQNAYIVGTTRSRDFPIIQGAFQETYGGDSSSMPDRSGDAFFVKLSPSGHGLFASYLGGAGEDSASSVALGLGDRFYLATRGSILHALDGRSPIPCDTTTTLVAIDRDTGRVIDYAGVRGIINWNPADIAADRSGIVHVAGYNSEPYGTFSTTDTSTGSVHLARLDFTKTDTFAPACLVNAATNLPGERQLATQTPTVPTAVMRVELNDGVAPGEIFSIFGVGLGPRKGIPAQLGPDGTYPKEIAGTQIRLGDRLLPLLYVSESQVNAIVPPDLVADSLLPLVIQQGDFIASYNFAILPVLAGLFTRDGSGKGQAAALNQDGSVNSQGNPAASGSVISLFATGMGKLTGPVPAIATHFEAYAASPTAASGAVGCEVLYAGPAPGFPPGVYQINVRLPATAGTGTVLIQLADNAPPYLNTQPGVYVSIK